MNRKLYIRLFVLALAVSLSLVLVSYVRASRQENPSNECGNKCESKKAHTEYILWESLTRNLLIVRR